MFRRNLTPSVLDQLFIFWTSGVPLQFAPLCTDPLLSAHSFCIEQSRSWLALVLWLLKFSSNFSEIRTRTRTRSFKWIKWLLNFSASVAGLSPLWESPDLHRVSWIFSSLHCLKFQLCTVQNLQSVNSCFKQFFNYFFKQLFHGKKNIASCPKGVAVSVLESHLCLLDGTGTALRATCHQL